MENTYKPGKAWVITALLSAFMLINFIDKIVIGLVAVPMMEELNLSPTEFGLTAGSFYWLFAISGIVVGFVSNRVKAKSLLIGMALIWAAAQLPIALTSSVAMIVFARVLLGMGEGPAYPVAAHALFKWFPNDKRNLPVALINMGSSVGLLVAGGLIPVISAKWGWRANFLVLAAVGMVWVIVWWIFGAEGTVDDKQEDSTTDKQTPAVPYAKLLTNPTVIGIVLLHFVAFWAMALTLTWLPAYMQKGLGYEAIHSGRMFALVIILGLPVTLGISWWSQRMMARGITSRVGRAMVSCLALIGGGALFFVVAQMGLSGFQKVLIIGLLTGLIPVIISLGPTMMSEVAPSTQRGGLIAIENSIASTAGLIAPVVAGYFIEMNHGTAAQGYETGFMVSGALLIVGGLIGLVLVNPEKSIANFAATAKR